MAATDANNDSLTYDLGGADASSFDIVSTSGQIRTISGVTYDHEAKSSYTVTVTASNGAASATATVTINVNDVAEPPSAPAAPAVSADFGSATRLSVSWTAPANSGKPPIIDYDLQYRRNGVTAWTNGPQNRTGTTATITGLAANTTYQVRVRAANDEGDSAWSAPGSGATGDGSQFTDPPTPIDEPPEDLPELVQDQPATWGRSPVWGRPTRSGPGLPIPRQR